MDAALATVIVTIVGGIAIAIIKLAPRKTPVIKDRRNGKDIPISCPAHSGLVATSDAHHEDIIEIKSDVKELRKGQGEIKTLILERIK